MNQIEFVDIVSKPVAITFRRIQTLGIYCWQYEKTERRAAFFLPRLSFNSNKEYLENLYPGISKKDLKGKGIFTSIWKIAKFYNKVSILNPEEILYNDFATLSAFKCWVENDLNLKRKKEKKKKAKNSSFKYMFLKMSRVLQSLSAQKLRIQPLQSITTGAKFLKNLKK